MVKIAVATNKNFFEKSLPILLPTLLESGLNKTDVFIFNAGFDVPSEEDYDGFTMYKLNHNSFEYSPLIDIVENKRSSEYWFLIHDTCKVGPNFKTLIHNIPENKPYKMAIKKFPSMSIGLYRYDYLLIMEQQLLGIKNPNYDEDSLRTWKDWGVSHEDFIMYQHHPEPEIYPSDEEWSIGAKTNWYGETTWRREEYYPSVDLYKNKANWGQTHGLGMVINL